MSEEHFTKTAETLGELLTAIEEAIAFYGPDTKWHGWDDGRLIIEQDYPAVDGEILNEGDDNHG